MNSQKSWIGKVSLYCRRIGITPELLIKEHSEFMPLQKTRRRKQQPPKNDNLLITEGNRAYFNLK